ncbi:MAG: histidine phosphatase family protein [Acidimicrobiales bacterium]
MPAPRQFRQEPYQGPPGSTELLLIRHGASADAIEGTRHELLEGQGDPPLSPAGRSQAARVGARLAGRSFAALYVSSLRRTAETAEPLARHTGLRPVVDPDLREVFLGEWEGGLLRQKVADRDPVVQRIFAEESWAAIPGAEPAEVFGGRLRRAVTRIAAAHVGATVAVFCHAAAIGEILAQASGARPFAFINSDNTAISRLIVAPDRWIVRGYNDTAHLDDQVPA